MARSYERPIIEVADDLSEGVFMASGNANDYILRVQSYGNSYGLSSRSSATAGMKLYYRCTPGTTVNYSSRNYRITVIGNELIIEFYTNMAYASANFKVPRGMSVDVVPFRVEIP